MGQAKIKQREAFASQLIEEWEADDCVNFAVALSRLTGWLLHVDWWSTSIKHDEEISVDQLKPLRMYVADNHDRIFDVRGTRRIVEFTEQIIKKRVSLIASGNGAIYTRFYDEAKLSSLPLRSPPNEISIARAAKAIQKNQYFLRSIPSRTTPHLPAHQAARFSFGECVAFAEAMQELTGLRPAALLASRFLPHYEGTQRSPIGYFHSVVLHPDGMAEDSWGKATLKDIADRFGASEFTISVEEHHAVVEKIRRSNSERYNAVVNDAMALIRQHRL